MRQNDGRSGALSAFGVGRRVSSETNPMNETPSEGPGPVTRGGPGRMRGAGGAERSGKSQQPGCCARLTGIVGMLLLQDERDLEVHLVALYVAVLDQDVLVLDPSPLHTPESLGGAVYSLVDGVL